MRNIFLKSTWATALSVSVALSFLVIHISLKQTFNKKRHLLTSLQSNFFQTPRNMSTENDKLFRSNAFHFGTKFSFSIVFHQKVVTCLLIVV